jgi:hypothetical protein
MTTASAQPAPSTMTTQPSMTLSLPAQTGWHAVSSRVEGFAFIAVAKRNRQPAQGCFPMTD